MKLAYSTQDIRRSEYKLVNAAPVDSLMKKAAEAVAQTVANLLDEHGKSMKDAHIVALVGGGDNGGDALYACGFLQRAGACCRCVSLAEKVHERAKQYSEKVGVTFTNLYVKGYPPRRVARRVVDICDGADVIIDAMLGTGARGALRQPMCSVVRALNHMLQDSKKENDTREHSSSLQSEPEPIPLVVAVDVPSGIGGDDGIIAGDFLRADTTVTMGARKPSSMLPPACWGYDSSSVFGSHIHIVDLGLELPDPVVMSLEKKDVRQAIYVPDHEDHKYSRGVVQVIAGSRAYPMTGVMCVEAAARTGAGMVRFMGPEEAYLAILSRVPETVIQPGRAQSLLIGPGITPQDTRRCQEAVECARQSLSCHIPLVLDAGGLHLYRDITRSLSLSDACIVLTPHAGEAATLLSALGEGKGQGGITRSEVEEKPYLWAHTLAELTQATVILKGAATIIASSRPGCLFTRFSSYTPSTNNNVHDVDDKKLKQSPSRRAQSHQHRYGNTSSFDAERHIQTFVQHDAPPWCSTAGSGDVLAGICAGILASAQAQKEKTGSDVDSSECAFYAAAGVWIHSIAARMACGMHCGKELDDARCAYQNSLGYPILASDITRHIPHAIDYAING